MSLSPTQEDDLTSLQSSKKDYGCCERSIHFCCCVLPSLSGGFFTWEINKRYALLGRIHIRLFTVQDTGQLCNLHQRFFEHRCSSAAYLKFFFSKVKSNHVIYVRMMNRTFDKILK